MKNTLITISSLGLCLALLNCANAQDDVPESVQKAFTEKYPGENDPDWHKDDNGNFESNFKIDGKSLRADFSPDGQWIETESDIDEDDLPKAVRERIEKDYADAEIAEIEEVEHHSKGKFYDVEFKQKGKNHDVEIKADGTVIN